MLIETHNLEKEYQGRTSDIKVLKGFNLRIRAGESVAIVGVSGVGKTTLLHIMGALDYPTKGDVIFQGRILSRMQEDELAHFRNRTMGFVFQFHHLLPEFTALENVMMPLLIQGVSKKTAMEKARSLLERLHLENRLSNSTGDLSGGEQQRVAVARALVCEPLILFADEPTGNLDRRNAADLHKLLMELNQEKGITLLVVTHDWGFANMMSRRVEIVNGRAEERE